MYVNGDNLHPTPHKRQASDPARRLWDGVGCHGLYTQPGSQLGTTAKREPLCMISRRRFLRRWSHLYRVQPFARSPSPWCPARPYAATGCCSNATTPPENHRRECPQPSRSHLGTTRAFRHHASRQPIPSSRARVGLHHQVARGSPSSEVGYAVVSRGSTSSRSA